MAIHGSTRIARCRAGAGGTDWTGMGSRIATSHDRALQGFDSFISQASELHGLAGDLGWVEFARGAG